MRNEGGILSCDLHEKKLRLIREGAERLGITILRTEARDASVPEPSMEGAFDLVIADVPCSGFGVMRKKPDIRNKDAKEVEKLPELQLAILSALSAYTRPGGTLLYATCTVLRGENEELVSRFLRSHGEYRPVDFEIGGRRSENGCYTFWPQLDGTDGFFVAKLRQEKP